MIKYKSKDKADLQTLQTVDNDLNNLPLKGVPGSKARISDSPGAGWTLQVYNIETETDGYYVDGYEDIISYDQDGYEVVTSQPFHHYVEETYFKYPIDPELNPDRLDGNEHIPEEVKTKYKKIINKAKNAPQNDFDHVPPYAGPPDDVGPPDDK